ncbi:MAG: TldD/PmbA family protein [Actinobacteria bacterium]|nr:MAG: TldD/PmbA family protein [Actinomycetota bacterium]
MSEKLLSAKLEEALSYSKADQTEVMAFNYQSNLTRFAGNTIHQNMSETNNQLLVKAIVDKKIGVYSANSMDSKTIKEAVEKAYQIAASSVAKEDFVSLPEPNSIQKVERFFQNTADFLPEERAEEVAKLISKAKRNNLQAAGAYQTGWVTLGVANSLGLLSVQSQTEGSVNTVITSYTSSGFASARNVDVSKIDIEDIAGIAINKALSSQNPIEVEAGHYDVILEPQAVAEMIGILAYCGLGSQETQEGRSFMSTNIGKQIADRSVSLLDDALNPKMTGFSFDFEGVAKQKVCFIDKGMAKNVVYDTFSANKEGKKSTGHALPPASKHGPMPLNLILKPGQKTYDDLIRETKKAVLVTRFHYTNIEDPVQTIFTGMTRDGTFLIENGKITKSLKNMRFTQSILGALSNTIGITNKQQLVEGMGGSYLCPAIAVKNFNFSSLTKF